MRAPLALAAALLAAGSGARAELPGDFCWNGSCSPPQEAVWRDFQRGSGLPAAAVPGVFSGDCWHAGLYDPTVRHHAAAVFDRFGERAVFGGEFSFFLPANPYAGLTLAQARERGLLAYDERHLLVLHPGHAEADLNPGRIPIWRYWFRQDPAGKTLYLLAAWDVTQRVFCRLERHADDSPQAPSWARPRLPPGRLRPPAPPRFQ